jgi:hypothetical protein
VLREIIFLTTGITAYEARLPKRLFLNDINRQRFDIHLISIGKYPELTHYGHYNHAKMVIPCICAMDPVSGSGILLEINLIN